MKKDIGEKNNLATKYPDIVVKLDKLIVQHLKDTNAIVPTANPNYDPDYVPPPVVKAKPVHGWQASHNCKLNAIDGNLKVTILGTDPFFTTKQVPKTTGPVIIHFQLKADVEGNGRVYWITKEDQSFIGKFEAFTLKHDKQWHEYTVKLPKIPATQHLKEIRIDPGDNPGEGDNIALFDWIRLETPTGKLLKEWKF